MNIVLISSLINAVTSLFLGIFVFLRNRKGLSHVTYALFCLSCSVWSFGSFLMQIAQDDKMALIAVRSLMSGAVFIPVFYLHHIISLLHIEKQYKKIILFTYLFGLISFPLIFTRLIIQSASPKGGFNYWPDAGVLFGLFLFFWFIIVIYGLYRLYIALNKAEGLQKNQLRYVLIATVLGWSGGATNYPLCYGVNFPPIGNVLVSFYLLIVGYAIVKYRLMDIRVALTRATTFIVVYSLVLGLPVWIGFKYLGFGDWLLPVTMMGVFATVGPFVYLYVQKRTEDALMAEQKRYQTTLRQASAGMGRIKDLKKLLNMIVYVLTRAIRLDHAMIYIYEERRKLYVLGASKCRVGYSHFSETVENNVALIRYLLKNKVPIIHEEIKQRVQDFQDPELVELEKIMSSLEAELIIPIFVDQNLTAIVAMGKKESGKLYNEDDLSVFTILANQAALAIENAQFYEDMKKTQEQLFQAEKMATIGTMADGLSHQINNRFHALGFIAGDALDTIKICKEKGVPDNLKETFIDLERAFNRVQENVVQGGEVVQGLLRYTRKGDEGFVAVNFEDVFKSAYEMAQFKIKTTDLKVVRMFDPLTAPKIKGNFTQLQEVFFNLIDNGYDAMMQRKTELKEPGFVPTLKVYVNALEGNQVELIFEDNGAGVKPDDMSKLFTPFFTTKLSSKKGTGLGLYVIKKIIEDNHKGQVIMDSQYMVGTKMKLRLPVAFE